ncbi:DUF1345 domain-containing protein [Hymenobacter sp. BT491]|uniref:DUF1345 domain-containing protein n=1 Tax=Hymenobacter sp. BT491 TaxID=2766779 RepID=UPI0016538609|nr:DUF1345 domain-containing protein [Hymenobacter sp. BT491]MBC6991092.1 DUF1345 domain-containing protein [Hymenobacter sp. BT491]
MPRSSSSLLQLVHRAGMLSATVRFLAATAPGILVFLLTAAILPLLGRAIAGWDAFVLSCLVLMWASILTAEPRHIRSVATAEDPGRVFTFVLVLVGAGASLLAVIFMLGALHGMAAGPRNLHVTLAAVAVLGTWLLLHTIFTLRYAHLYYDPHTDGAEGGLEFPGTSIEPDYLDFAYFSFVVGMTAQTADIGISGRTLRRIALLHGILSFGFNTAVIALSISGLSSIL